MCLKLIRNILQNSEYAAERKNKPYDPCVINTCTAD
jgi:hypothetical protein